MKKKYIPFLLLTLLSFSPLIKATKPIRPERIEDSRIIALIDEVKRKDLRSLFRSVTADKSMDSAEKHLPNEFQKVKLSHIESEMRMSRLIDAVRNIIGGPSYRPIIINYPLPFLMSDSNCLIVISTGALKFSDDALIGAVGHELAHAAFAVDSLVLKAQFNEASKKQDEGEMRKKICALAEIELKCDVIAALVLSNLKKEVEWYGAFLDAIPDIAGEVNYHPDNKTRQKCLRLAAGKRG